MIPNSSPQVIKPYKSNSYIDTNFYKLDCTKQSVIANPLSILDIIFLLKICMGKVDDIGRNTKWKLRIKLHRLVTHLQNRIDMYTNRRI